MNVYVFFVCAVCGNVSRLGSHGLHDIKGETVLSLFGDWFVHCARFFVVSLFLCFFVSLFLRMFVHLSVRFFLFAC